MLMLVRILKTLNNMVLYTLLNAQTFKKKKSTNFQSNLGREMNSSNEMQRILFLS
jgi:hypothetical protein